MLPGLVRVIESNTAQPSLPGELSQPNWLVTSTSDGVKPSWSDSSGISNLVPKVFDTLDYFDAIAHLRRLN